VNQELAISVMTRKFNTVGGWCGTAYAVVALIGWWLMAGFWPLHSPTDGPETIAAFFQDDLTMKRLGLIVVMWAGTIILLFTTAVANHLSRIEGRSGPLTHSMLLGGYATAMLTFYPPLWWLTAAFRPERAPDLLYMLNDIGWLQFVGGVSLVIPMYIGVAIASFVDQSPTPTFPRWTGYFSIWVAIGFGPGQLLFLFKSGPFAWDGLFPFWLAGSLFFTWFIVVGSLIVKASAREKRNT
jgi:hypothetical protein